MASRHRFVCCAFGAVTVTLLLSHFCFATISADSTRPGSRARSAAVSPPSRSRSSPSAGSRGNGRGRASSAGQTRSQEQELPYYMVCPEIHCPEVPSTCQTVEFIAYDRQFEVRGRGTVTVRCHSCEYCLDVPAHLLLTRDIRSGGPRESTKELMPCSSVRCPLLSDTCIDVRLTSVVIGHRQCGQCPVCYDRNVINVVV